ncbi:GAF and ANTAR domain-containing protein [Actinomadura sp. KC216]|uniref:GAF and ANTAR domain-containing protein n=1 Tax=Actinomadura sp. KC216 TaxID=2530370 RepID=UPI001A9E90C1|nr:GAF and ANTAR domain-containing protein [Actinomadura sp. KC216]
MKADGSGAGARLNVEVDPLVEVTLQLRNLQQVLAEGESLEMVLGRLAETVRSSIDDVWAVSVTVVSPEGARTVTATHESVVAIDAGQYEAGEGPCLEAARGRRPVRASVQEARQTWPAFAGAAAAAGFNSYLSVPLILDEQGPVVGALNLYGRGRGLFDPVDEALLRLFTAAASAAIVNARRGIQAVEMVEQLRTALASRAEIDQAKGVLMAVHGVDAEEAFELLVQRSQHVNVKLREVARSLLADVRLARPQPDDAAP